MPNLASAKKNLRKSRKTAGGNLKFLKSLKNLEKDPDANHQKIQSLLDKAVKKGIFHRNKASRLKSKLFKKRSG
ncbi:MAG: 30S ribosomal protein S20 [Patescibacteria group bacterium]|nr:30S ribosomal protein S20 [Patescibacteria group bacterium]